MTTTASESHRGDPDHHHDSGKRIYGFWARHLDAYALLARGVLLGKDAQLRAEAVARLALRPSQAVLDLACGPGTNLSRLEGAVGPSGRVVEFDYSEQMLARARDAAARERWTNVDLLQGDAARLALADESMDGALCTLGLSAMPDPEAAIRQVHRCLRAGARFAVVDAKLPEGAWAVLDPLLRAVFVPSTNWNTAVDLIAAMSHTFGNVKGRKVNRGSVFLAVSTKLGGQREPVSDFPGATRRPSDVIVGPAPPALAAAARTRRR